MERSPGLAVAIPPTGFVTNQPFGPTRLIRADSISRCKCEDIDRARISAAGPPVPSERRRRRCSQGLRGRAAPSEYETLHRERAVCEYELGTLLRRTAGGTRSTELLRRARDRFRRLGVPAWAQRCDRALAQAGWPSRESPERPNLLMLNSREQEVAHLVARGLTNREAAQDSTSPPRRSSSTCTTSSSSLASRRVVNFATTTTWSPRPVRKSGHERILSVVKPASMIVDTLSVREAAVCGPRRHPC